MDAEPIRPAGGQLGARRVASSLVTGAAGLAGGVLSGAAGMWLASIVVGPVKIDDPRNLVGNAILLLGPLLAIAAGAVLGFVTGAVATSALLVLSLNWPRSGRTIAYLFILEAAAVPLTLWVMIQIGNRSGSAGSLELWLAALVVGGLVPTVARLLALRIR